MSETQTTPNSLQIAVGIEEHATGALTVRLTMFVPEHADAPAKRMQVNLDEQSARDIGVGLIECGAIVRNLKEATDDEEEEAEG